MPILTIKCEESSEELSTIEQTEPFLLWPVLRKAGWFAGHSCSGVGMCVSCCVQIIEGKVSTPTEVEHIRLASDLEKGKRLACQTWIEGDTTVVVPRTPCLSARPSIHNR